MQYRYRKYECRGGYSCRPGSETADGVPLTAARRESCEQFDRPTNHYRLLDDRTVGRLIGELAHRVPRSSLFSSNGLTIDLDHSASLPLPHDPIPLLRNSSSITG